MLLNELLPIAGVLTAPAFFLLFALAALGSPLLALVCLASGQLCSTQYIEAYARRLLRMALTASLPALLAFSMATALLGYKSPWMLDWLKASPIAPGLLAMSAMAFFASLLTLRLSRPSPRHARQNSPLAQAFILSVLTLIILWLTLVLAHGILEQAKAVLRSTVSEGLAVAPLITPDASALTSLLWTSLAAIVPLCAACAGILSQEYLLLLRDREPFGREALTQMLRIAARCTLRSTLLAAAFLPVLWTHLPDLPALPDGLFAAKVMLGLAGACVLLMIFNAGYLSRSGRPWTHSFAIHLNLFTVWVCLSALLCVALLCFYGT